MAARRHGARVWTALWIVYLVWGSTYLGIKFGVDSLPPLPMLAIRFLVAGTLLLAWCARRGLPRPTRRQWRDAAVVGTCLAAFGNGGVGFAETRIDSGLAALIVAVIPLWIALLGRIFLGERLSGRGVAGIAIGLAGVAVLVDPGGASAGDLVAVAAVLGGSFAWAAGSIYATTTTPTADPLLGVAMQMLCGGVVLAAMGAGQWSRIDPGAVTAKSLIALGYLILVGSVLAYTAYGWLLHNAPAPLVATYAYVNPVVAVLLGTLFANEALTVPTIAGGAVIVVAVMLIATARPRPAPAAGLEPALEPAREAA
jgi:drug/metabolite transporter (DMT)-like permease